jgi:hypothetical protein
VRTRDGAEGQNQREERGCRRNRIGQQRHRIVSTRQPVGHDAGPDDRREQHRSPDRFRSDSTRHPAGAHRSCRRMTIADAGHAD